MFQIIWITSNISYEFKNRVDLGLYGDWLTNLRRILTLINSYNFFKDIQCHPFQHELLAEANLCSNVQLLELCVVMWCLGFCELSRQMRSVVRIGTYTIQELFGSDVWCTWFSRNGLILTYHSFNNQNYLIIANTFPRITRLILLVSYKE